MPRDPKTIFISFVEEAVLNPEYHGYIGGRIEVLRPGDRAHHSEEIRFFTRKLWDFEVFRDLHDWTKMTEGQLNQIKATVRDQFMED